jgi:hypothetical protein
MVHRLLRRHDNSSALALARGLGWFSIALGVAELIAPRSLTRSVGLGEHARIAQFYGLREIAAGIGILLSRDPKPWVWGRVAGDVVDMASLAPALRADNPDRARAGLALAAVAAVTALDIACARQLGTDDRHRNGILRRLRSAAPR